MNKVVKLLPYPLTNLAGPAALTRSHIDAIKVWCQENNVDARWLGYGDWWIDEPEHRTLFMLRWTR